MARLLLECSTPAEAQRLNQKDAEGNSPIIEHLRATDRPHLLGELLSTCAVTKDEWYNAIRFCAQAACKRYMLQALVTHGACTLHGAQLDPMLWNAVKASNAAAVTVLGRAGANPWQPTATPLIEMAIESQSIDVVRRLLECGGAERPRAAPHAASRAASGGMPCARRPFS